MQTTPVLGVIGGSGLYSLRGLEQAEEIEATTPFGAPSAPIVIGLLAGVGVAFLARHGRGHHILPSEVNYRANLYALKALGVRRVLSISACGSLREDFAPGHIVVPDQIVDWTRGRPRSFFGDGMVAHVGVADPFCPQLSPIMAASVEAAGGTVHPGGTLLTIEGPRFSTRAESNLYRTWGMDVIGMTASPEAFLAREAELCYTVLAHVTDYDVWHLSEEPVTAEAVLRTLQANARLAEATLTQFVHRLPLERTCPCGTALQKALVTSPEAIPAETRRRLALLVDPYLG
ncbi:MAG TPA: S-methyl-5'-thioadenosine phosphorylase [Anaerolineales bacterium]|nr:S-methyl-5'-thioadenosine phosphorylase [Anaerolineales bacterium]